MNMKGKLLLSAAVMLWCGSVMAQPASFSEPQVLIKSSQSLMAPVWSPDGTKLAVTGDNYTGIWVANADGSELRQVSDATGAGYKMQWTDASSITATPYTLENQRRMTRVERIDVATGVASVLQPAARELKRSRIMRHGDASLLQIMVDEPLAATERIAALNEYAGCGIINPALSPDGQRIAFQIAGKGLFVINTDGSGLKYLGAGNRPSWLPDSKNVMVTRLEDNGHNFTAGDLYCVSVDNGNAINVTPTSKVIPTSLSVSPNGQKVAFSNDVDGCIYIIDLKY